MSEPGSDRDDPGARADDVGADDAVGGDDGSDRDVRDSAAGRPGRGRAVLAGLLVVAVLAAVVVWLVSARPDEPADDRATPTTSSSTTEADLVGPQAPRLTGAAAIAVSPGFQSALTAAHEAIAVHCPAIPRWAAAVADHGPSYQTAVLLLTPANRRDGRFTIQVELNWAGDHYQYAVVVAQVRRCA